MTTEQRTILVTYDGSEDSRKAFQPAARLAKIMQAGIILLRVRRAPNEVWVHPEAEHREKELVRLNTEWEEEMKGMAAELAKAEGIEVIPCSRMLGKRWNVAGEILAVADEYNVELLCMATHGESSVRHFFVGSTALDVLSQSKRPVTLVNVYEAN